MKGSVPPRFAVSILLLLLGAFGCTGSTEGEMASSRSLEEGFMSHDSVLAVQLGADEFGMRSYVVAFLKAGPTRVTDSTAAHELQKAHMENIFRLADEGSLLLQGPFLDDGTLRGFYVFNVTSLDEARALVETDPAIQTGHLEMELHPWYGSAALQEVYGIHRRIRKRNP